MPPTFLRLHSMAEPSQLTVSEFMKRLSVLLDRKPGLQRIAIVGEISDWKTKNGNVYFELKEGRSVLACFAFASEARAFPPMKDGDAAIAVGTIGLREQRSQVQLRVVELTPTGIGVLAAQVEALRERLRAEGAFETSRKRAIPVLPASVALISAKGKGAQDFMTTLQEQAPQIRVAFVETRVQGEGAQIDIAEAFDRASKLTVDVTVVLRGGGSYEDRFPFNTEPVVRAIMRSPHPVITAIGHEGDEHLADAVADAVFKTPTAAAEAIARTWQRLRERVERAGSLLVRAITNVAIRSRQQADAASERLWAATRWYQAGARDRLQAGGRRLDACNPQRRLADPASRFAALRRRLARAARAAASLAERRY